MMVDTIAELASLSETLNKKSDSLNSTINSINKRLQALNFGMNVMLGSCFEYEDTGYRLAYGKYGALVSEEGGIPRVGAQEWQLGIYNERSGHEDALLRAPREVRIRALDYIPVLLELMKHKAEGLIESIERAEKLAENL